jgi:predicted metal-dependent phosphoesterase TrpH
VNGIPLAMEEGEKIGVEIIPGVELSTEVMLAETSEMHILGYYIDWKDPALTKALNAFQKTRQERAEQIIQKLEKCNIHINRERLFSIVGTDSIGRLHFAKIMKEQGVVSSINDAFHRFLGIGKPAYVPKMRLSPEEAIKLIAHAGGISVLAHPYYNHYSNMELLHKLIGAGLCGIEAWHSKHPPSSVDHFTRLAKELGLLITGGSDCHGSYGGEPALMGSVKVPYSVVEQMLKYKKG